MAYYAVCELLIHFNAFKNVDLYHQGLYKVRVTVRTERGGVKGLPVAAHTCRSSNAELGSAPLDADAGFEIKDGRDEIAAAFPASINDHEQSFTTTGFFIRYCDEEVRLHDIAHFRLELDASRDPPDIDAPKLESVLVKFELLYASFKGSRRALPAIVEDPDAFSVSSSHEFRINDIHRGVHEVLPVTFDEWHFTLVNTTIHSCLLQFKFRQESSVAAIQRSSSSARRDSSPVVGSINPFAGSGSQQNRLVEPAPSLAHLLFPPTTVGLWDNHESIGRVSDTYQARYLGPLARSYRRLAAKTDRAARCLTSEQLKDLGRAVEIPQLQLPGGAVISSSVTVAEKEARADRCISTDDITKTDSNSSHVIDNVSTAFVNDFQQRFLKSDNEIVDDADELREFNSAGGSDAIENISSSVSSLSLDSVLLPNDAPQPVLRFSERLGSFITPSTVATMLQQDVAEIAGQIVVAWGVFLSVLLRTLSSYFIALQDRHEAKMRRIRSNCIVREAVPANSRIFNTTPLYSNSVKIAAQLRKNEYQANKNRLAVEEVSLVSSQHAQPIIFEQKYIWDLQEYVHEDEKVYPVDDSALLVSNRFMASGINNSPIMGSENPGKQTTFVATNDMTRAVNSKTFMSSHFSNDNKGVTLIVFIHGFMGNAYDLRLLRNYLFLLYPHHEYLLSQANEEGAEGRSIQEMGDAVAAEIVRYVEEKGNSITVTRLSFVTHSLGGLVARACLAHKKMAIFRSCLYSFVSICSPHCGYMFSGNTLVDTGLWVLKKWKQSKCLQELSCTDDPDPRKSYLCNLSKESGFLSFKNVMLISSPQDAYVPLHSCRVEQCLKADKQMNSPAAIAYTSMVHNLMDPLEASRPNLLRLEVTFDLTKKGTLDNTTGRSAHIIFLESAVFIQMLCNIYKDVFA